MVVAWLIFIAISLSFHGHYEKLNPALSNGNEHRSQNSESDGRVNFTNMKGQNTL